MANTQSSLLTAQTPGALANNDLFLIDDVSATLLKNMPVLDAASGFQRLGLTGAPLLRWQTPSTSADPNRSPLFGKVIALIGDSLTDIAATGINQYNELAWQQAPGNPLEGTAQTQWLWMYSGTNPSSGAFTINVQGPNGVQTLVVNWNDSAATIQTGLQALTNVGSGNILVTGTTLPNVTGAAPIKMVFAGALAQTAQPVMTITGSTLNNSALVSIFGVYPAGVNGATGSGWTTAVTSNGRSAADVIAAAPDLLIYRYLTNDARLGQATEAAMLSTLNTFIAWARANLPNADILLQVPPGFVPYGEGYIVADTSALHGTIGVDGATQLQANCVYLTKLVRNAYRTATEQNAGVALFDTQNVLTSILPLITQVSAQGLMADSLHFNGNGFTLWSRALGRAIGREEPFKPELAWGLRSTAPTTTVSGTTNSATQTFAAGGTNGMYKYAKVWFGTAKVWRTVLSITSSTVAVFDQAINGTSGETATVLNYSTDWAVYPGALDDPLHYDVMFDGKLGSNGAALIEFANYLMEQGPTAASRFGNIGNEMDLYRDIIRIGNQGGWTPASGGTLTNGVSARIYSITNPFQLIDQGRVRIYRPKYADPNTELYWSDPIYPYKRRGRITAGSNGSITLSAIPGELPANLWTALDVADTLIVQGRSAVVLSGATYAASGANLVITKAGTDFSGQSGLLFSVHGNHAYEDGSREYLASKDKPWLQANGANQTRGSLAPTGAVAQSFPRNGILTADIAAIATGQMFMVAIEIKEATQITNISFLSGATAANTPTNWWFALYSSARALLAQTADQTSTAWAANTLKTLALTTAQLVQPGLYYVAIMMKATTPVSLVAFADTSALSGLAPILHGTADGSLTTTAPATSSTITATANNPYCYVS